MSGGSLDYFYYRLEEHAEDFGDKELNDLVKDLAELFHDREWYLSGDTCEGDWIESRDKFKAKWFTDHGRQERIEKYLSDICREVRDAFGMSNDRCQNCKHWAKESDHYGKCDFMTGCLSHRSESCDKYEKAFPIEWNNGGFKALMDLQPQEAINKLKAYEENQKADDKIEVGDEVIYNGTTKCLVVRPETDERYAVLIDSNGNHHHADHSECKKTGRHFDIGKILEEMRK